MKIYHYTSIEVLRLILQNRTIRFNRTDRVDDKDEIEMDINGMPFAKYLFVSCWTTEEQESIPQWKIYADGCQGIRISLDSEHLFNNFFSSMTLDLDSPDFDNEIFKRSSYQRDGRKVLPVAFIHKEKHLAYVPIYLFHGSLNPKTCGMAIIPNSPQYDKLYHVEYVDSLKDAYSKEMKIQHLNSGKYHWEFSTHIGYKKNSSWDFQKEARFVLMIMLTYPQIKNGMIIDYPDINFAEQGYPPISPHGGELLYYDVTVDPDAFDYMEVIAGPETSEEQYNQIQNLLKQFAPSAKLQKSICNTNFNK